MFTKYDYGGKYCCAGLPNKMSWQNRSSMPAGITHHRLPKDPEVRRQRIHFIKRNHFISFFILLQLTSKERMPPCVNLIPKIWKTSFDVFTIQRSLTRKQPGSPDKRMVIRLLYLIAFTYVILKERSNISLLEIIPLWKVKSTITLGMLTSTALFLNISSMLRSFRPNVF